MKTYYINLERAEERRNSMEAAFPLDKLIRVGAADGMDWASKGSKSRYPSWNQNFREALVEDGMLDEKSDLPPTHAACNLSHISALEMFLKTKNRWAIIMEDDVIPAESPMSESLSKIVKIPSGCDLFYLMGPRDLPGGLQADKFGVVTRAMTLAAYAISRRGAKIIIEAARPMMYLLDGQIPPCCFENMTRWVDRFCLQKLESKDKIIAKAYPDRGIVKPSEHAKISQLGH